MRFAKFQYQTYVNNDLGKLAGPFNKQVQRAMKGERNAQDHLRWVVVLAADKCDVSFAQFYQAMQSSDPARHLYNVQKRLALSADYDFNVAANNYAAIVRDAYSFAITLRDTSRTLREMREEKEGA